MDFIDILLSVEVGFIYFTYLENSLLPPVRKYPELAGFKIPK